METELLYLEDGYQKEATAKVVEASEFEGNHLVVLDKTIFYPTGGGQLHDEGKIICGDEVYEVSSVYKFQNKVMHVVDKAGLAVGDEVQCSIDWERRYRLMRMHTCAHVLSKLIEDEADTLISGNQLGLEKSRLDFNVENFDREFLMSFAEKVNQVVARALHIEKFFLTREEADKDKKLFTLLKGFPEGIEKVRIVNIENFDKSACGGTHLKNTSEIGTMTILKLENKGKQRRRIVFTLD